MIDLLVVLVLLAYAVSGYRQGALVGLLSLAGFLGGGALAMWALPNVLDHWFRPDGGDARRVVLALVGVLLGAMVGQAVALRIGLGLRRQVTAAPVRLLDAAMGAVAGVVGVSVLVWLVAGALRGGPSASLSREVGRSRVVSAIDALMPSDTGAVFAGFRSFLDAGGFPRVFEGFGPEVIRPVAPPDPRVRQTPGMVRAARGVVKVTGLAGSCSRSQEGTGWVLAPQRVVTNAHVVAAVDRPRVQVGGEGQEHAGRVVVFDPLRDLAVIDVPDLDAPALPRADDLARGQSAVVAGYPLDGPYRLDSARVREVITARGRDIYGARPSPRRIYSLYARVQPGNSGGPLLDPDGRVVGVVFAKSLDDDLTGYALTTAEAAPVLAAGTRATAPVDTGPCTAS